MNDITQTQKTQDRPRAKTDAANIFAVDRETWNKACDLGLNAAVAYLVLARGTGGDNRTTSWSAHAVETYTGIGRDRAPRAIQELIDARLITRTGASRKPQYRIEPAYRVPGCPSFREDADEVFGKSFKPAWVWLPNYLVQGLKDLGEAPVEALRRRRDLAGLRLLINLYGDQTFAHEGGLDWSDRGIRRAYSYERPGRFGDRIVYAYKPGKLIWSPNGSLAQYGGEFEPAFKRLLDGDLVRMIPHVVDGIGDAAEVIHTLADAMQAHHQEETGPHDEADRLARRLVPADNIEAAKARGFGLLVPAPNHWSSPVVVGIARLTWQANAKLSSDWETRNIDRWYEYARDYRKAFNALESATSR